VFCQVIRPGEPFVTMLANEPFVTSVSLHVSGELVRSGKK
jgi:hypothetical protein